MSRVNKNNDTELITKGMLNEAVESILTGMDEMIKEMRGSFSENKSDHLELKRKIDDLSADTPTMKAHMTLNEKVDHHIKHHRLAS